MFFSLLPQKEIKQTENIKPVFLKALKLFIFRKGTENDLNEKKDISF